jgi:hypothetical protein
MTVNEEYREALVQTPEKFTSEERSRANWTPGETSRATLKSFGLLAIVLGVAGTVLIAKDPILEGLGYVADQVYYLCDCAASYFGVRGQ